ncbi:hypothetical protein F4703DRAFT_1925443 [Phycomyces blakesleeanus]
MTSHHKPLDKPTEQTDNLVPETMTWPKAWVLGARFPKKPGGTTLVPRDTLLGRLTIDVNIHESTAHHGSPPDQTTKGIHRTVSLTRN